MRARFSRQLTAPASAMPELELPPGTFAEIATFLHREHRPLYEAVFQPTGAVKPFVRVFRNGQPFDGASDVALAASDEIEFIAAIAGG